ncbi:hypothetical protein [Micromonospora polyrhachis]|uniref:PRC-barrel domain-containing protein n=1 Tax=Micromonospora polyrhachis TaxID=1282883 RepID=A0A7W7SQE2_9ACTN|nr:hypothetical protein [Micromonospora polyrhachis]MBB4958661.1 hypothetical protein [Micromonospora polyrhachis]
MQQERTSGPQSIAVIVPGMRVVDAAGVEVGTVDLVQLGDPNAVTVQAPTPDADVGLDDLIRAGAEEPEVPADTAARLLREGFLKVDARRPLDGAVYVEADQIGVVSASEVRLNVLTGELAPEE